MDQVTKVRRQLNREQWKNLINDCRSSGMTVKKPAVLKRLEVQTPVPNTQAAVIIHFNGANVEINEGTSRQTIQAVLVL